jgi:two-component system, NtrC family, sensor kinase
VYDRFADEVKKLVDFDRMNVHTVNAADGTYTIKYLSGLVQTGRHSGDTWPLEGTQTQQVVETGQTSIVYDHAIDPKFRYDRELLQVGLRSRISLPLTSRGAVIGTLALHSRRVGAYGPREQAILERLAHLIGPAIENARLHQAAQDYAAEITLVAEISRIITSTLNIDEVYEKFAQEVKKLVDFDRMNIHVIDGADGVFTIRHLSGPAEDGHRSGDIVPLEGTQTQQVIETGQPAITHDYAVESRFLYDRALLQSGLRPRICLPLSGRGNIIGSLTLHSRRVGAYGPREQAILERLAHQIGPAIENARLYEQVRLQAQLIDNVSESVVAKAWKGG